MLIFRLPWPTPRWRDVLTAITPVMHAYNYRRKDLQIAELLPYPPDFTAEAAHFAARLDHAFTKGSTTLPEFDLFAWKNGRFVPVRQAFL
jgi:hypothetical protein